jgi:glutaminyl-peptide cyclotransferase
MDKRWAFAVSCIIVAAVLAGVLAVALNGHQADNRQAEAPVNYSYSVVNTYPHDTQAYTEGLIFDGGWLYESIGTYAASSLRKVDLQTGKVLQQYNLSSGTFGEGLAVVDDSVVQLTWQNQVGYVYDKASFSLQRSFDVQGEGWGLTYDGQNLIMSNGSSTLAVLNPQTYQVVNQINVNYGNDPLTNINELEYINGSIYANIWHSMKIAIINPQTGQVTGIVDLTGIYEPNNYDLVLNGIAYDAQTGRLLVTGKNWPNLYEITLKPQD